MDDKRMFKFKDNKMVWYDALSEID